MKKQICIFKIVLILSTLLTSITVLNSSDRTDALELMKQCETESLVIEICVKNFGDEKDNISFEKGLKLIKMGKVKIAQSKHLDAIEKFNEYIQLQYNLYKSLGEKYIERTTLLIDDIAMDLADYITDEKVLKNFETANSYLIKAKDKMNKKKYADVIFPCRFAKYSLVSIYKMTNNETPQQYMIDLIDYEQKIQSVE